MTALHILVAEDESLCALGLQMFLEGLGHRVSIAQNGVQAAAHDAADPADLLVTDIRMPLMNGVALVRALRARRPDLPVVVISAVSAEAKPLMELPGVAFIPKPADLMRLRAAIADLTEARHSPPPAPPHHSFAADH